MTYSNSEKERIAGERLEASFSGKPCNPATCMTCLNANGEPPWADSPMKSYCLAFPREDGARKPPSVYYDGGPCEFYRGV